MSSWAVRTSAAAFQLCLSLSVGLICHEARKPSKGKADPPKPRFSSIFLCLTNSYESLTLKESIVIHPTTAYSSCGKREKEVGVRLPQWTGPPFAQKYSRLNMTDYGRQAGP